MVRLQWCHCELRFTREEVGAAPGTTVSLHTALLLFHYAYSFHRIGFHYIEAQTNVLHILTVSGYMLNFQGKG